jgi:hypothetical protein
MPAVCTGAGTANPTAAPALDYLTIMGGISYPLTAAGATTPVTSVTDRFCDMTWPQTVTSAYVRCKCIKKYL